MQDKSPSLTEVTWNDIRLRVKPIAPDIFEAIEGLSHNKDKYSRLVCSANALDRHLIMGKWRKHPTNNELAYRNTFMRSCVKIEAKKKG